MVDLQTLLTYDITLLTQRLELQKNHNESPALRGHVTRSPLPTQFIFFLLSHCSKKPTPTASYISQGHLPLPSLRSERTHYDCDLHQRMPPNSSIAAVRKDTQRLRARSTDVVRGFHRCGQKRHTTTATYINGCLLTLPSLRSEKTHNDCELDQRMSFEDSIAAVRKDTQRLRPTSTDAS